MSEAQAPSNLTRTPLFDLEKGLKARMTEFGGWEMPVQYQGIKPEHHAVRQGAGMFDISHMGKFVFKGKQLLEQFQTLVPSDLGRLQPGKAQYTVLLNDRAGIVDDLIFYYQGTDDSGDERWVVIVNAATTDKDKAWFLDRLDLSDATFEDWSNVMVLLAVQGPQAVSCLQAVVQENLSEVPFFGHLKGTVLGQSGFLARTGYTGEDGFEVMVEPEVGRLLWQSLLKAGVEPCGLGARDTLRLEAALCLYGQDIDDSTSPLEAGLSWLVHLDDKGEFIGRSILTQQKQAGVERRLVGLQMQCRNIARHGYALFHQDECVGEVTSGTLSPTLNQPIALAYVSSDRAKVGQVLEVEIRGKRYPAQVVKRPFYRSSHRPKK